MLSSCLTTSSGGGGGGGGVDGRVADTSNPALSDLSRETLDRWTDSTTLPHVIHTHKHTRAAPSSHCLFVLKHLFLQYSAFFEGCRESALTKVFFFKCPCLSSTTVQQPNNDHGVLEAIIKIIVSVTIISPTSHLPSLLPNEKDNFRFTGPQHY